MDWSEVFLRIGLALAAGAAIGLNRDMFGKPTGVRLHGLVAIAAAATVMCGIETDRTGPSRVIQGIVGGIGFLGAGVIMRGSGPAPAPRSRAPGTPAEPAPQQSADETKRVPDIHYLTTAASIWLTAALGIAAGLGQWRLLVVVTIAAIFVLLAGLPVDRALYGRFSRSKGHDPVE